MEGKLRSNAEGLVSEMYHRERPSSRQSVLDEHKEIRIARTGREEKAQLHTLWSGHVRAYLERFPWDVAQRAGSSHPKQKRIKSKNITSPGVRA
jgi:hypothetical protein